MSIKARIEEAELLWENGHKVGAWILTLIAAAGTSRKRYPRPMKDGEAFKSFIRDVVPTIVLGVPVTSGMRSMRLDLHETPLEDVFYHELRCNLLHEGTLSPNVSFSQSRVGEDGRLQADLVVGPPNKLPDFWVTHLMQAVREAPENASEFAETA